MALASWGQTALTGSQVRHSRRSLSGPTDVALLNLQREKQDDTVLPKTAGDSPKNRKQTGQNSTTPTSRTGKTRRVSAIFGEFVGKSRATAVPKEAAPATKINKTRRATCAFGVVATAKDLPDEKRLRQQQQQQVKENKDIATSNTDAIEKTIVSPPLNRLTSRNYFRSISTTYMPVAAIGVKYARISQAHSNKVVSTNKDVPSNGSTSPMACQPAVKSFSSLSSLRSPTPEKSPPKRLRAPSCHRDPRFGADWSRRRSGLSPVSTDVRIGPNSNSSQLSAYPKENVTQCRLGRSQSLRREPLSTNKRSPETEDQYKEWYALLARIRTMNLSRPCEVDPPQ